MNWSWAVSWPDLQMKLIHRMLKTQASCEKKLQKDLSMLGEQMPLLCDAEWWIRWTFLDPIRQGSSYVLMWMTLSDFSFFLFSFCILFVLILLQRSQSHIVIVVFWGYLTGQSNTPYIFAHFPCFVPLSLARQYYRCVGPVRFNNWLYKI